jgi:diacylglycerol kinase family enzyme
MKAIVVFNGGAGSVVGPDATVSAEGLRNAFAAAGVDATVQAASGRELAAAFRAAVERRPDAIFAGGGDGTISTAASHLVDTGIPLGVLPLGTLNHFARDLGVPAKWRDAIPALAAAPVRAVDVAEVNGRIFINNCSLGSYAEAVRRRDRLRRQHGHGKWRAMAVATWGVFRELRRLRFDVNTPDDRFAVRSPVLIVANNRYAGRVLDSSLRPRLDEGRIWIYTTRARNHGAILRLFLQTLTRPFHHADELDLRSGIEATVEVRSPLPVAADGELLDVKPPLRFRSRPGALHVLAPPQKPAS